MVSQGDIQGRLRLFRYGLIVLVIVTFLVSLLAPYAVAAPWAAALNPLAEANGIAPIPVNITDFAGNALLITLIVGVVAVVLYFVYAQVLKRSAAK